jgi:hypothetical protein
VEKENKNDGFGLELIGDESMDLEKESRRREWK